MLFLNSEINMLPNFLFKKQHISLLRDSATQRVDVEAELLFGIYILIIKIFLKSHELF